MAGLLKLNPDPDLKPARLVEYLSERAGVIVPRGVGVYTFPHRTFQEYLAACHLTDVNYPALMASLARKDPQKWREVALLAGAKSMKGIAAGIWLLAEALCCNEPDKPAVTMEDFWGALFAGQMLAENMNSLSNDDYILAKLDRIKSWQVRIIGGDQLPAVERVSAGNSLAVLGNSRFDPDFWYLPRDDDQGFVRIPSGPFLMGSTREEVETFKADMPGDLDQGTIDVYKGIFESEIPQHPAELSEYYIARYPVTVAQYRLFMQDTDYQVDERWDGYNRYNNHPVVYVSWKDAEAYCKWLTDRVKDRGWKFQLPTEAQWEKAARGEDGRTYPWGNARIRPERANYSDTGIGSTSPVGCFAKGMSPYNVLDSIGNVWEWCLDACDFDPNIYKIITDTYRDGIKNPLCEKGSYRVVRGGSWRHDARRCRTAYRHDVVPGRRNGNLDFRLVLLPGQPG
ncbi:MAG: formylglycine-generating enzyme family protein [bacterium]|nr:formylglycine-generating enzyme family protein [bacterium]